MPYARPARTELGWSGVWRVKDNKLWNYIFFKILVSDGIQEQEALNKFLAQSYVVDIEKEFVSDG